MDPVQPDPSDLMQQLMGLGSVDQRFKMLQEKAARGAQLAQGVPLDFKHGSGASQLASALASLVGAGVGGYDERTARAGQQDLVDKTAATKSMLGALLTGNEQPDLSGLATASDADLPGKTDAARTAIGGQRKSALLAMLSGDQQLAPAGKTLLGEAEKGQETLQGMPQARIGLHTAQRGEETATSPVLGAAGRQLLAKLGVNVPEGTPASVTEKLMAAAEKAASIPKTAVNSVTGEVYDVHTGKPVSGQKGATTLDDGIVDREADRYNTTGEVHTPKGLRGPQALNFVKAVMNRAQAKIAAGGGTPTPLAEAAAGNKADTASLAKLQTQSDAVNAFEKTALGNLQNFLKLADNVPDVGIPYLNDPIRKLDQKLLGSPDMAAFGAARQVAINEIAKVLNNPGAGGGAVSDSARHEVESLIGPDASLKQIKKAAQVLVNDMETRKVAVASQIAEIRGRLGGKPAAGAPASPPAAAGPVQIKTDADFDALPPGADFIGPDGKHRKKP